MKKIFAAIALATALTQPALAGDHRWGNDRNEHFHPHHGGGIDPGSAVILGLGGLMLGAAINEQSHRYGPPPPPPVYYYPPPPPAYYYREPYCVTYETRDAFGYLLSSRTVCR